jgi:hypothetical protein
VNWTWSLRSPDGGMNGLEFARCTTAGGIDQVLVHAAPANLQIEVRADDDEIVARGELGRKGDYSPMTLVTIEQGQFRREEVWPDDSLRGVAVILAGGEVGRLQRWEHSPDRSWWRWSIEFSNHTGRPADWSPDQEEAR